MNWPMMYSSWELGMAYLAMQREQSTSCHLKQAQIPTVAFKLF